MHIGEPELPTLVAEGEALVVDAKEVEDGRVEVVDVDGILRDAVSEFIEPPEESRLVANPCTGYGYRQFIDTIEDPFLTFGCS